MHEWKYTQTNKDIHAIYPGKLRLDTFVSVYSTRTCSNNFAVITHIHTKYVSHYVSTRFWIWQETPAYEYEQQHADDLEQLSSSHLWTDT